MPARGDVNPSRTKTYFSSLGKSAAYIPIVGYDKVSLCNYSNGHNSFRYYFILKDGSETAYQGPVSDGTFTDWIQIPDNALYLILLYYSGNYNEGYYYYSLLTKDSPYNPDNQ